MKTKRERLSRFEVSGPSVNGRDRLITVTLYETPKHYTIEFFDPHGHWWTYKQVYREAAIDLFVAGCADAKALCK